MVGWYMMLRLLSRWVYLCVFFYYWVEAGLSRVLPELYITRNFFLLSRVAFYFVNNRARSCDSKINKAY